MHLTATVRLLFVCLLGISSAASAGTIYVSTAGNDANNGLSWASAKKTAQAGLSAATSGDQVWVAAGTYVQCITLKQGVALYGGFAGSETNLSQRNWRTNVTILDGDQAGSVVTAPAGATTATRIDGFTIRNGMATQFGGGVYCDSSSPTITNNTITGNTASSSGGGIYCKSSSPTIANNAIVRNAVGDTENSYGGGIYCDSSSPTIITNTITCNYVNSGGGGICCVNNSSPTIANDTITGNFGNIGGVIYCDSSSPTIANTIIAFNSSGIYASAGTPTLRYCCVYDNGNYNYSGLSDPTGVSGNTSVDPQLADLGGGNMHLQPTSPCINAGDDTAVQAGWTDIDGQARKLGTHVDIGADESDGTLWPAAPAILYVSPGGNDGNDGLSWASAKRTVQAGIDAGGTGSQVWVAAGTYVGTIQLAFGVALYGGFAGSETALSQRSWQTNATILDGNQAGTDQAGTYQAGTVVTAPPAATASTRIDGFTIRNGNTDYGGGVYCYSSSPTIANNTISGNKASHYGGGIYCCLSSPTITNNTITGNTASSSGGGICCDNNSSPTITNNTITGNGASSSGGGIYCINASSPTITNNTITLNVGLSGCGICCHSASSPTIAHNTITGNVGLSGGGIYCDSSSPTIAHNTITGNAGLSGGGILCDTSSPTISNNTITGNMGSLNGGGIYCYDSSSPSISNNMIAGNSADTGGGIYCYTSSPSISNNTIMGNSASYYDGLVSFGGGGISCNSASPSISNNIVAFNASGVYSTGGTPTLRNNCVFNPGGYNYSGLTNPTGSNGNISVDPQLLAANYGEVHLKAGSPCIDAGLDSVVQTGWVDMDGQSRIQGLHVDIGADEFNGTTPTFTLKIVRVGPSGNDASDGSTWALAKQTVQAGIDAVVGAGGGEVWVAAGTYNERITLKPWTYVYGGFAGTENGRDKRDWVTNTTILDGGAAGSVVTASALGYGSGAIDGFTIRNGSGTGSSKYGGGIICNSSSPSISNNTITGNSASNGGGIYCVDSSPAISNNMITGNSASSGGGIYCQSASPSISNNMIMGNSATDGGGIYCYSYKFSPSISNNTITGNSASSNGGGIYCYCKDTTPSITNTIIAFNSSGVYSTFPYNYPNSTPTLRRCCIYGNSAYNYSGLTDPTGTNGNISTDPRFVATPNAGPDGKWATADDLPGNLHLAAGSSCINAGDDTAVQAGWTDIDGQARKQGTHVDIGADEWSATTPPTVAINSPTSGQTFTTSPVSVTGTAFSPGSPSSGVAGVGVRVNGGAWEMASGTTKWSASLDLTPGTNQIDACSADNAGSYSLVVSVSVTYAPGSDSDNTPPTPNPSTWSTAPTATGTTSIHMTATTASDPSGVQYFFHCLASGGHDSGWQDSPTYEDTGLSAGTTYSYQVKTRDKSTNQNEGAYCVSAGATTQSPTGPVCTLSIQTSSGSQASITVTDPNGQTTQNLTNFTHDYGAGSSVTVTASQTLGNATFSKWTLDGDDYSTDLTVTVQMDAPHALVAVYETATITPPKPKCGAAGSANLPIFGVMCLLGLCTMKRFVRVR